MSAPSLVPAGVHFEGSLEGEGDLVVHGAITGPIRVSGALWIEEGAIVRGHVQARVVTVRGVLKGDAYGEDAVRVGPSARLIGDLTAPRVQVVPGARFKGRVHVQSPSVPLLDQYDPARHTLAGQEAPRLGAPIGPPTMVGAPAPSLEAFDDSGDGPRDSESPRLTIPIPPPPPESEPVPLAPMPSRAPAVTDPAPAPPFATPARGLRMPTLGRTRGRRRDEPR